MINVDQSPARLSLIPRNLRRPALQARQDDRLRATLKWASANSVFWAKRIGGVDLDAPGIRSKLGEIPFTSKEELLAEQDAEPPFGRMVCVPPSPGSRVFSTSGTTGNSFLRVFSDNDWRRSTASVAESVRRVASVGDLLMLTSPADGLMGPSLAEAAIRRVGAIPISAGKWSTEARVRFIQSVGPSAIAGTTSYLLHLGTRLREAGGAPRMPRGLMCFGEPGAGVDETVAKFRTLFGDEVLIEDGYGLTEVGPISSGCTLNRELHLREESLLAECVDPLTGEPAPEGVLGELVFTTLTIEAVGTHRRLFHGRPRTGWSSGVFRLAGAASRAAVLQRSRQWRAGSPLARRVPSARSCWTRRRLDVIGPRRPSWCRSGCDELLVWSGEPAAGSS